MAENEVDEQTIFVENLPFDFTHEKLEAIFGDVGPLRECYVVGIPCRGIGFVKYALPTDARAAIELMHGKEVSGRKLRVSLSKRKGVAKRERAIRDDAAIAAGRTPRANAAGRKAGDGAAAAEHGRNRMIVRNLAWKVDESALTAFFSAHGKVSEVVIPLTAEGKGRGFAFVEMASHSECNAAITALNLAELGGRPIAVDFAVAKDRFDAAKEDDPAAPSAPADLAKARKTMAAPAALPAAKPAAKAAATLPAAKPAAKPAVKSAAKPAALPSEDEEEDDEEEEDEDDEEEGEESEEEASEEEEEEEAAAPETAASLGRDRAARVASAHAQPSDAAELSQTVFVQNLSFEATADELREALSAHGRVLSALLVTDPTSGLSRGSAFVRFASPAAAASVCALSSAAGVGSEGEGVWLRGRQLRVLPAVDRSRASKLVGENTADRLQAKKDAGSTHGKHAQLASLGVLFANSPEAAGMPPAELRKHEQAWARKKAKLKSPHFVVSSTRLSVRNVPWAMGNAALEALFARAAQQAVAAGECKDQEAPPLVQHAKLVLEQAAGEAGPGGSMAAGQQPPPAAAGKGSAPRSAGFGFVQFAEHTHALAALHRLAHNAAALAVEGRPAPKRGLLIEFALDDTRKLELQRQRRERARSRGGGRGGPPSGLTRADESEEPPAKRQRAPRPGREDREARANHAMQREANLGGGGDGGGRDGGRGGRGAGRGGGRGDGQGAGRGAAPVQAGRGGGSAAGRGRGGGEGAGSAPRAQPSSAAEKPSPRAQPLGSAGPAAAHAGRGRGRGGADGARPEVLAAGAGRGGGRGREGSAAPRSAPRAHDEPRAQQAAKQPGRGEKRDLPAPGAIRANGEAAGAERARKVHKTGELADDRAFDRLVARHKESLGPVANIRAWLDE